ncbi:hypothetical protein C0Q70_18624 [Pomacea canaliculata]|uniref:Uncharacterized protein n=1 Tax=Pomacea canaliculata TaxID=400727 RepID=A0A2T7NH34_POMCA|nr:hypothetical protein C0Q70_18624 [Pomacea canaliculata]
MIKKSLTAAHSKATKADNRPSAVAMGITAGIIFALIVIGIVLLDAANLWRDVSGMLQNIGVYYQHGGVAPEDRPLGETSTRS